VPIYREPTNETPLKLYLEQRQNTTALHPGIASVIKAYELDSGNIVIQSYSKHSMLSLSRFHAKTTLTSPTLGRSAGPGSRDLRLRFIVYQLLQALAFVHEQGLYFGSLAPSSVMLDDTMWVTLPVGTSEDTINYAAQHLLRTKTGADPISSKDPSPRTENDSTIAACGVCRPVDYYEPITVQWSKGKITNFEYLMCVNFAAGRFMADPLYHPIVPWATDFVHRLLPCNFASHSVGVARSADVDDITRCKYMCSDEVSSRSFRDLTKTKFRLSKGDHQLETTFRHSDPSHHVPESLSELTYYIYMARRTPMQVSVQ
jgi:serine/threonine protein kinase